MIFIEMPVFSKVISFTDDELRAIQDVLVDNPEAGDLISGSRGCVSYAQHWQGGENEVVHA